MTDKTSKAENNFENMKIIDSQEVLKRLKETNEKWFDRNLVDYKKDFYFPIETIPMYKQKDIKALDSYIKYYILKPLFIN